MENYLIGKVNQSKYGKEVRCKCGGQAMVDGEGYHQVPTGFGFRGNKFVVDAVRQRGYFGACLQCHKKVFAPFGKPSRVTRTPRSINRKIKTAQSKGA